MKRYFLTFTAVAICMLLVWHCAIERRQYIRIQINGIPATTGLQPFARSVKPIFPDSKGRYSLPPGMNSQSGYEFKFGIDRNWLLNFPSAGTTEIEITDNSFKATETLRYFGIFATSKLLNQQSIMTRPKPNQASDQSDSGMPNRIN